MIFLLSLGFIIGASLGSFIKVLADRSLSKNSFSGRSYCDKCKKHLLWYDLFPIFSYLVLRGKCRFCKTKIPLEYLLVEILMGILVAYLLVIHVPTSFLSLDIFTQILIFAETTFQIFIISILVTVFLTDFKTGLIPDQITYPAAIITISYLLILSIYRIGLLYYSLSMSPVWKNLLPPNSDYFYRHSLMLLSPVGSALVAAAILTIFFASVILLTRGKGMGGGDLKLGVFLGLAFGFPNAISVLMLAFLTGSIAGIALILLNKKKLGQTIPFGPFLSLGGILTIFWGQQILSWYLNLKF